MSVTIYNVSLVKNRSFDLYSLAVSTIYYKDCFRSISTLYIIYLDSRANSANVDGSLVVADIVGDTTACKFE
jgi:hypothetical protein